MSKSTDLTRLEVLKNALDGIADGMALTVIRTSRSSVVRTGLDFSTALLSANGELIGQGMCQPVHLGGMMPALHACLERYEGRIFEGDILCSNDPYEGGSHLPDIFLYKPMYMDGRLLGYTCAMSHHTDIGGRVAGGNACDSTEIYQEGLRIPPLKLYERGVANDTLFRLLEKAVRVPDKVLGDLTGNIASLHYGEKEYGLLVKRHGLEQLEGYVEELLDYTETLTRKTIQTMPDGEWTFTDHIDSDGIEHKPIAITATLKKSGDQLYLDFDGTSPQCKGAIQPVMATTRSISFAVLKCVMGAMGVDVPNTAGYFRPMHVTAPEGTFVNPLPPAPVAARTLGYFRVAQTVFGAFSQMMTDLIPACPGGCELGVSMSGYDKSAAPWKPWLFLDFYNEQARGGQNGIESGDAHTAGLGNMSNIPVEQIEAEQPLKIVEYGFTEDSEGAGEFRGGIGQVREYEFLMDETLLQVRADRMHYPPYGLMGGDPGRPSKIIINMGRDTESRPEQGKFITTVNKGDRVRFDWSGAGGWGNSYLRDPKLVLEDVIEEKITVKRAKDKYGVIIDTKNRKVDDVATEKERALKQS